MSLPAFELSPIKAMELAAAKVPNVISLAQGIPSFSTPEVIKDFVKERIYEGVCDKYSLTVGLTELREEIALALSKEGLQYDPETEIVATAGSIQGITASILAITSPGDEVVVPSPTYTSYRGSLAIGRCNPIFVPLDEDRNFDFEIEAIERAITKKTRAILYCSPNNPTGTLYSEENTRLLMKLVQKHNLYVIVDEVYKDFYYTDDVHFSPTSIADVRNRVIRVCSFSKSYAMTGWRIGFVHTDREIMAKILKFHDAMVSCAPVVSQYAAIAALRFGAPHLKHFTEEYRKRRDYTLGVLDSLSHILDYQLPRATYFVFPRIKDTVPLAGDSTKLAYDILQKVAVATVPGVAFGPTGESHLRINFGRSEEVLKEGMDRLGDYFARSNRRVRPVQSQEAERTNAAPTLKRVTHYLLAASARLFLKRSKPKVIGIVGTRGKTVFKRVITDALEPRIKTRASILSYNTDVGLPLSILNLHPPKGTREKIKFALKLLKKALIEREDARVLVLEYGILSAADAEALLSIAKPDWLVVTDISSPANENGSQFHEGIKAMLRGIGNGRVLWADSETSMEQAGLSVPYGQLIELPTDAKVSLSAVGLTIPSKIETVTQSLKHASYAAYALLNDMKLLS